MLSEGRTLVVLRHGRTAWNDSGRAQGHTDVPLDQVGRTQARAAAVVLAGMAPVRLWSSDLARARQTAAELEAVTGLRAELSASLREYDVGQRAGLTLDEFATRFPEEYAAWTRGNEDRRVAGAEASSEVRRRMLDALRSSLSALGPGETGVVVTHGAALRVGVAALLGWPDGADRTLRGMDNCGWLRIVDRPRGGGLLLASYNETTSAPGVTASVGARGEADFASDGASG